MYVQGTKAEGEHHINLKGHMATWPAEVRPNLQAIMRVDSVMELKSCSCVESKYLYHVPTCQRMDQQGVQNVATPTSSCVRGVKKGVS